MKNMSGSGIGERSMGRAFGKSTHLFFSFLILFAWEASEPPELQSMEKIFRNSVDMEFVLIPSGSFEMGSPLGERFRDPSEFQHPVTLKKSFYLQSNEVTVGQWSRIMGKRLLGRHAGPSNLPVTRVSWFDCSEFIKRLNEKGEGIYRLPTEAEWEYACRAGGSSAYHSGPSIDCAEAMFGNRSRNGGECTDLARSKRLPIDGPAPVRSYGANAWGLFDMHGNVWEWCSDWYGDYPRVEAVDPVGLSSGSQKVRRGGSWVSEGHRLRCANRAYAHPASRFRNTGFRLVMEVP
jgi:formylglycine-generating enzyme required for sulfatase activity